MHLWSTLESSIYSAISTHDELQILRSIAQERKIAAGGEIFREGDTGDGVYFVKSGLVEISGLINAAARHVFSQLGPGEIFGEMAVIEDRPRSATATALKETEIYFIPRGEMLALHPTLARASRSMCCRKSATASANSTSSTCAKSFRPNASPSSAISPAPSSTT